MSALRFTTWTAIAAVLLVASCASAAAAESRLDRPESAVVWKPKLDVSHSLSRALRGVAAATATKKTESCYSICTTCICAAEERLNCCARESGAGYAGCVPSAEDTLCATHRSINTCCRLD